MALFLKFPDTSCKGAAKLKWKDTSVVLRDGSCFISCSDLNHLRESLTQHNHSKGGECIEGDDDRVWHVIESIVPSAWSCEGNEVPCETPSLEEQQKYAASRAPAAAAAAASAASGSTGAPTAARQPQSQPQRARHRSRSRSRSGRGTAAAATAPQRDDNHAVLVNILHQVEFIGRMLARLMPQQDRPDRRQDPPDRRQDRPDRRRLPDDDEEDY